MCIADGHLEREGPAGQEGRIEVDHAQAAGSLDFGPQRPVMKGPQDRSVVPEYQPVTPAISEIAVALRDLQPQGLTLAVGAPPELSRPTQLHPWDRGKQAFPELRRQGGIGVDQRLEQCLFSLAQPHVRPFG
jgi:hypothetical protein